MNLEQLNFLTDDETRIIIASWYTGEAIGAYKSNYVRVSDFDKYEVMQIGIYDTNTLYAYINK